MPPSTPTATTSSTSLKSGHYVIVNPELHTLPIVSFDASDTTQLQALHHEPPSPFMRRLQDSKSISKTKERCTKYNGTRLFNGIKETTINWKLRDFKIYVWKHCYANGMGDIFAMVDNDNVFNLVFHYHRLPKSSIDSYIVSLKACSDAYDDQNLSYLAEFLFALLDPVFESEVRQHALIACKNPNGLELWSAIMDTTFQNSYRSVRSWKDSIRTNSITNIAGQNVEQYFANVMEALDHLDGAGVLGGEDLMNLLTNLEDVDEDRFRLKIVPIIDNIKLLQQQQMALGSSSLSPSVKWENSVQHLISEYRTLVGDGRWRPAVKSVKDGPDFDIRANAALQQTNLEDRTSRGTQHRITSGTGGTGGTSQPPPTGPTNRITAEERFKRLTTPPAQGAPTKKVKIEGLFRPRSWCPICFRWFYHDESGHAAYVERNPERFATTQSENTAKNIGPPVSPPPSSGDAAVRLASSTWDDDDDDFINICSLTRA